MTIAAANGEEMAEIALERRRARGRLHKRAIRASISGQHKDQRGNCGSGGGGETNVRGAFVLLAHIRAELLELRQPFHGAKYPTTGGLHLISNRSLV